MKSEYVRKGDTLECSVATAVERGDVVKLGDRVGIAVDAIPAGGSGFVHVVGVFSMNKPASQEIAGGATLYLDEDSDCVTAVKDSLTLVAGIAAAPAAAAAATVDVRIG